MMASIPHYYGVRHRAPPLHPCLPVPLDDQKRLNLLARLSLEELRAGRAEQALVDLAAIVLVSRHLAASDRFTEDARRAVEDAAQALQSVEAGTTSAEDAVDACGRLAGVFEQLLLVATGRRFQAAQAAAAQALLVE